MSLPRMTGALCGALAILFGSVVLVGWLDHSTFLIQLAANLPPMQRDTAVSFVLTGVGLVGIAVSRPRLTLIGSAIMATLAVVSLLEYLFRVSLGINVLTELCFMVL